MSVQKADPLIEKEEMEEDVEYNYFDDCDHPLGAEGPSSVNYISKNIDYEERDADGNPIPKEIHRTWPQFFLHWKPMLLMTLFNLLSVMAAVAIGPLVPFLLLTYIGGDLKDAEKKAVLIRTAMDSSRALVAFFIVPVYGKLLDTIGRRPFFIFNAILGCLPYAFLFALPRNPMWFMIFSSIAAIFGGSYQFAFLADCYEERDRAKAFAISSGISALGTFLGLATPKMHHDVLFTLACILSMAQIPLAFFFFRETLPRSDRRKFKAEYLNPNPIPAFKIIWRNKVLRLVTIIVSLLVTTDIGAHEILSYYLIGKLNLTKAENAYRTVESGLLLPLIMLVLFPLMSRVVRPTRMVFISFVSMILGIVSIMLAFKVWVVFVLITPLMMGISIGIPSLIGIFANAGEHNNQGMRMAGITAVMDLVKAIVPLAIGFIFKALPSNLAFIAFGISLVFSLPALPLVWFTLPKRIAADRDEQISKSFSSNGTVAVEDEAGSLAPGKKPVTVQDIAKQAAKDAEGKKAPLV